MRVSVSVAYPTKFNVYTKKELKGRGIKNLGLKSNGETRYLLTQKAFEKIRNEFEWVNEDLFFNS